MKKEKKSGRNLKESTCKVKKEREEKEGRKKSSHEKKTNIKRKKEKWKVASGKDG